MRLPAQHLLLLHLIQELLYFALELGTQDLAGCLSPVGPSQVFLQFSHSLQLRLQHPLGFEQMMRKYLLLACDIAGHQSVLLLEGPLNNFNDVLMQHSEFLGEPRPYLATEGVNLLIDEADPNAQLVRNVVQTLQGLDVCRLEVAAQYPESELQWLG
jgi:hypothetical protein